jgi:hypothetical protein|tara:strand:- start:5536 stop:5901 length:366 start_codon:yes stop_codon:yes gene_type:complete
MKIKIITKNILSFLSLSLLIFIAFASEESEDPTKNEANITALEEIKKEPKVKEAIITDVNVLYVSVEDDSTNRNGFAQYLCEILNEHKATTKWVKIVKFNSINDPNRDNAYGVLLGESNCN